MTHSPQPESAPVELSRDAYTLLAHANLLRMRGQWEDAVEKCMAAMRLAPESATAQSLLGDIYDNQGRMDDAIQWYRMALDVNPDSPADKIKLARLLDLKVRALPQTALPGAPRPGNDAAALPPSPRKSVHRADRLLRYGTWLAAALIVIVITLAVIVPGRRRGLMAAFGAHPDRQVSAPPVILQPPTTAGPAAAPNLPTARDPSEQSLIDALRADAGLSGAGIAVVDTQIDPRAGRVTLTLLSPAPAAQPATREAVLKQATLALQTAARYTDSQTLNAFTVRCLLAPQAASPPAQTPLVLTADTTRATLPDSHVDLSQIALDSLLSAYTNVWWSSLLPQ